MPEWSSGFSLISSIMSEFCNKELMIWARVSSWTCFCWLYRVSPSSTTNDIINLISVLTIWWYQCVESSSHVLGKGCLPRPMCSLNKTLLAFVLLHFVLQNQTCLVLQISHDFLLLHSSPLWWKGHLFWVLVLEGLVGLHRINQLQLSALVVGA